MAHVTSGCDGFAWFCRYDVLFDLDEHRVGLARARCSFRSLDSGSHCSCKHVSVDDGDGTMADQGR